MILFKGFLHKSGRWEPIDEDEPTHDDMILFRGEELFNLDLKKFGINSILHNDRNYFSKINKVYNEIHRDGWIRVTDDFGNITFVAGRSIGLKKYANTVHNFLHDNKVNIITPIELYYTDDGNNAIFSGSFMEFGESDLFESSFSSLVNLVEMEGFGQGWWFHDKYGFVDVGVNGDHQWALANPENDKYFGKIKKSTDEAWWMNEAIKGGWIQVRKYSGMLVLTVYKLNSKTKDQVWEICKKVGGYDTTPIKISELSSRSILDTNVGNVVNGFDFGDDLNEANAAWGNSYWYNPKTDTLVNVRRTHSDAVFDNEKIFGYDAEYIFKVEQNVDSIVDVVINDGWWRVTQQISTKTVYVDTRDTNNLQRNLKKLLDAIGITYDTKILVASFNGKEEVHDFYFSDGEIRRDTSLRNESHDFTEREFESVVDGFSDEIRDKYSLQRFELFLDTRYKNVLCLDKIQVSADDRRGGIGSAAMKDVCDFADEYGLRIWLTLASPDNKEFGTESIEKLQKFYSRFGFVVNTGAKGRGFKVPYVCDMFRKPK